MRIEKGRLAIDVEEDTSPADNAPIGVYLEDWGRDEGPESCAIHLTPDEAEALAGALMALVRRAREGK